MPRVPKTTDRRAALSRRHVLQVGGLGLAGLSLPKYLEARADTSTTALEPKADSCIVIFLNGGPSHLDMWDMKPDTGEAIRGEFQPINTSLPGYQVCELLPRLSRHVHRSTVVRSMHHGVNNSHAAAVYAALTGHDRGEIGGGARPDDNPNPGSVLAMLRRPDKPIVPHVHLPYITQEGRGGPPQPGFFGGYLGRTRDPLFVLSDPNAADFAVPELTLLSDVSAGRLAERRSLLAGLDRRLQDGSGLTAADQMSGFQHLALDLLTSEATQQALDLAQESAEVREKYGRNRYGQSTLLGRRLIEAGTRMVTVSWAPDANATWDTHGGNFQKLRSTLLPEFDAACASLIEDLADRGMLERTIVAVMGDFGRSPKINKAAGRDHWNHCYSLMLFGGGFQSGLIYGSSDKIGAYPSSDPLIPGDIIAGLYHLLGIPRDLELTDALNRPRRLVPTGNVIHDLFA